MGSKRIHLLIIFVHPPVTISGLEITAGQRTMSGQNGDLSGQNRPLTVMLTGHPIIYFNKSKMNWISLYFCGKIITLLQINAHPTVDMVHY